MKHALIFSVILLVGIHQAWAQQSEGSGIRDASIAYGQCVVSYSRQYAETHELPADIVLAAFGWCFRDRDALSSAIAKEFTKSGLSQPDRVNAAIEHTERDMQRAAIRAIFEKRYPAIK